MAQSYMFVAGPDVIKTVTHEEGLNFAYPTAEIAVMGPEGAVNITYRRELAAAKDPEKLRQEKVAEFREKFANPFVAPNGATWTKSSNANTRVRNSSPHCACSKPNANANPPKKHGNIPL